MKIIVIIVTYNGMKWYKQCLDSLQTSSIPMETIVIDNNSSDNTVNFIKENYPEIHLVESKENLGFGKANNIGFKYAIEQNADYVFLLNQDAYVMPATIEQLCFQMKKNPEYGILSPIHLNGTEQGLDIHFSRYISPTNCPTLISDYIAKGMAENRVYPIRFVNAALWLVSRECLDKIGGFCPLFYHYGEDSNYADRLLYHQVKIGIYPLAKAIHDRAQKKEKVSDEQRAKRFQVNSLLVLCNINHSVLFGLLMFMYQVITGMVNNKFKFFYIKTWFKLLFMIPQIIKHRNTMKKLMPNYI